LNLFGEESHVNIITPSQTFLSPCKGQFYIGHVQNFHSKMSYTHYCIHSAQSWNAFSTFHFTFCEFVP